MPIDRLRGGRMSDAEVLRVAVDVIRLGRIHGHPQDAFNLLADRLEEIKLPREEHGEHGNGTDPLAD